MTINAERDFSSDARMGVDVRFRGKDPFGIRFGRLTLCLVDSENEEETRIILTEGQARVVAARLAEALR